MTPNEKHVEILAKVIGVPTDELKNLNRFPDMYNCLPSEALTAMKAHQEEHDAEITKLKDNLSASERFRAEDGMSAINEANQLRATIAQLNEEMAEQIAITDQLKATIAQLREEVERLKDSNKHMVKELASAQLKIKELNKDDY